MTGLSKITDKIINEARAEAAEKLAAADEKCAEIKAEYAAKAAAIENSISVRSKAEAEELISRARSGEETMQRNILLEAKGKLIDKAFERAKREISDMPVDEYLEFMTSLLAATFVRQLKDEKNNRELYGEDGDETVEKYEVLVNPRDRERLGERLVSGAVAKLEDEDAKLNASKLVLADDTANIDGGLVLRCGSMEINNSVKAMLGEVRPKLEAEVGRILFAEQNERRKG